MSYLHYRSGTWNQLGFGFQTEWLHCIMQNVITLYGLGLDPFPDSPNASVPILRRIRFRIRQCKRAIRDLLLNEAHCYEHIVALHHLQQLLLVLRSREPREVWPIFRDGGILVGVYVNLWKRNSESTLKKKLAMPRSFLNFMGI